MSNCQCEWSTGKIKKTILKLWTKSAYKKTKSDNHKYNDKLLLRNRVNVCSGHL